MPAQRPVRLLALSFVLLCAVGCRKSDASGPQPRALPPGTAGVNGCSAPAPGAIAAPVAIPLTVFQPDSLSQLTAAAPSGLLYMTGADATVVSVDVNDPGAPVETLVVAPGTVAAFYSTYGISVAPQLSGITVLDDTRLVVVEHSANVLLAVARGALDQIELYAGQPNVVPGSADGLATGVSGLARFSFDAPCQVRAVGAAGTELYVADSGNHSLRVVAPGQQGVLSVLTLAGPGFPLYQDGSLGLTAFDTPSGLSLTCDDRLILSELGDYGFGQRLRRVTLSFSGFGGLGGVVETLVGDGINATTGGSAAVDPSGSLAQVSRPVSPLVASTGELFWIDSGTGVLRRLANGLVDCPLSPDCESATADFTAGGLCSLTQTPDGTLYVLDAAAGALYLLP